MSSSSARGQAEPVVALVCVAVLGVALAGYATAYGSALPTTDRDLAARALPLVADALVQHAAAPPDRLRAAVRASAFTVNATLAVDGRTWSVGPSPPERADAASRPVAVRVAPGVVRLGRLRVVAW